MSALRLDYPNFQCPLIKGCTLNVLKSCSGSLVGFKVCSISKGYWKVWVPFVSVWSVGTGHSGTGKNSA